ncbi:MAG TPA: ABC transporter permease [Gaiellaceae bacterium]|nr:ABC transporter permease [Gaiellaceae bacterium]
MRSSNPPRDLARGVAALLDERRLLLLIRVLSPVVAIGVWELVAWWVDSPASVPDFQTTVRALWSLGHQHIFWSAVLQTLRITAEGIVLAIAIGIPIGILMGISRAADAFLSGYVNVFNAMPRIVLIPLFVVWFGIGSTSKIVVVLVSAIFPTIINTYIGITSVEDDHKELARSYCASRLQEIVHISLPTAVPSILGGVRLSIGHGVVGAITAELLLAESGIGGLITTYNNILATASVYALVIVLAVIGVAFVYIGNIPYRLMQRRRRRWVVEQ